LSAYTPSPTVARRALAVAIPARVAAAALERRRPGHYDYYPAAGVDVTVADATGDNAQSYAQRSLVVP
jgi:hypothetical protein